MAASDVLENLCELVTKAINNGAAKACQDHNEKLCHLWIGDDVFEIEEIDDDAFMLRYQNIECMILRDTEHWDTINNCFKEAKIDDQMIFSARKAVAAAVVERLKNQN